MAQQEKDVREVGELSLLARAANGEDVNIGEIRRSAQKVIDTICSRLQKNSPARIALEYAGLALKYETEHDVK